MLLNANGKQVGVNQVTIQLELPCEQSTLSAPNWGAVLAAAI